MEVEWESGILRIGIPGNSEWLVRRSPYLGGLLLMLVEGFLRSLRGVTWLRGLLSLLPVSLRVPALRWPALWVPGFP